MERPAAQKQSLVSEKMSFCLFKLLIRFNDHCAVFFQRTALIWMVSVNGSVNDPVIEMPQ